MMRQYFTLTAVLSCFAIVLSVFASTTSQAQDAKRSIEQVAGDVYRFQNNFHFAMLVVTNDGIVVTDPIDAEAVDWLKAELAKQFEKPVTHMIRSHHHADHASGGQAWGDITVLAHENFTAHVEAGEVDTIKPTETFADQHSFELGGKTFELTYLGEGHGDDMIVTVVRPENVAFVVDVVSPKRLPWRDFPHTDINGLIGQIETIESLDFDILAPGHSGIGTKQDATDTRLYIEHLRDSVKAALNEGKSEADILASDITDNYQDWGAYDQLRDLNIQGMIRWLKETDQAG